MSQRRITEDTLVRGEVVQMIITSGGSHTISVNGCGLPETWHSAMVSLDGCGRGRGSIQHVVTSTLGVLGSHGSQALVVFVHFTVVVCEHTVALVVITVYVSELSLGSVPRAIVRSGTTQRPKLDTSYYQTCPKIKSKDEKY